MSSTRKIAGIRVVDAGSNPDVDSDFNTQIRDLVLDHVSELHGRENVSNIITFDSLAARSAFKSMCTIYQIPYAQANKITGMIPPPIEGAQCTINDLFNPSSDRYSEGADFRSATSGAAWTKVIEGAKAIEGRYKSTGVHACGILISSKPLADTIPLSVRQKDGRVISQWTYPECESIGLIKFDFLGLDTVDLVQLSTKYIMKTGKPVPNMLQLIHGNMDDKKTFELFSRGDTVGVFQFGSPMVQDFCKKMKPSEFEDIAASTALLRPGPMGMLSHVRYAERKNGREEVTAIHPEFEGSELDAVLAKTYGLVVYQESILKIANQIAGMTLQEGDELRKAMGKKKMKVMLAMKPKFMDGGRAKGFSDEALNTLWDTITEFAKYGFNRCLAGKTEVSLADGNGKITVEELYNRMQNGEKIAIQSLHENGEIRPHTVKEVVSTGRKPLYTVKTSSGRRIRITSEHRLLTTSGYSTIDNGGLVVGAELIVDAEWTKRLKDSTLETRQETMSRVNSTEAKKKEPNERMTAYQSALGIATPLSDGRVCDSVFDALAGEYLLSRGVDFEMHKLLKSTTTGEFKVCDFYADGLYFEMDGMARGRQYFVDQKYGENLPFVYMTPLNYKDAIDEALMNHHIENGDAIVEIVEPKILPSGSILNEATFDIEMDDTGPSNFIADGVVSHNSHSIAYAQNAYQTAYLKANYPAEFMAALISQNVGNKEKILIFLQEARKMGLNIGSVDINISDVSVAPDFSGEGEFDIVYGIAGVNSVSEDMAKIIVDEREKNGKYKNVQDVINRCSPLGVSNKKIYESLAYAGAFDSFGVTRQGVIKNIPGMIGDSKTSTKKGMSLFDMMGDDDNGFDTVDMTTEPEYNFVEKLKKEADVIGLYLTGHPLMNVGLGLSQGRIVSIKKLMQSKRITEATIVGSLTEIEKKIMRKGKSVSVNIDDGTGYIKAVLGRPIVKGIDKGAARDRVEKMYVSGDVEMPSDVEDMVLNKEFNAIPDVEANSVYVMDITFRPSFDEASPYGARVNRIRPLVLSHGGKLPIRIRVNPQTVGGKTSEMKDRIMKFAEAVSNKFPGDYPIHAAVFTNKDMELVDDDRKYYKGLIEGVKSFAPTVKAVKKDGTNLFGSAGSVDAKKGKGKAKDDNVRELPPVDESIITRYKASEQEIAEALEYFDTGFTAAKNAKLEEILSNKFGAERVDFGIFNGTMIED